MPLLVKMFMSTVKSVKDPISEQYEYIDTAESQAYQISHSKVNHMRELTF